MQNSNLMVKKSDGTGDAIVLLFLSLSFFLLGMFRAFEMGNGQSTIFASGAAGSSYWTYAIFMAVLGWVAFELVLRLYYFFVSLSIYTFTVPKKRAFYVFRTVFIFRNLVVAGVSFLLFVNPLFVLYLQLMTLVVDFLAFVLAFSIINRKYLSELLAPFAWRAFLRPFLVYESIVIALGMGGLL